MTMETERLQLRRPAPEDDLSEFVADAEVQHWIGGNPDETPEEVRDRWIRRWDRDGVGPFLVLRDGEVIGRVGYMIWNTETWRPSSYDDAGRHAETELQWAILQRCWGNGYAPEAATAVRAWAARERGLERIVSFIDPRNVRSIRVADKLGCTPEQLAQTPYGPCVVWVHPR
jgi:RimJ/RimL family protein N-acetyltransferase